MFFSFPQPQAKLPKLSSSRWSKGITSDGYHVRTGQKLFIRKDLLPEGALGHCEKVEGVDKNGDVYSGYINSAWKGKPIPLSDCVTEHKISTKDE